MKIIFVSGAFELLGIEYLSAVLKRNGYKTDLVFDPMLFNDSFIYNNTLRRIFDRTDAVVKKIVSLKPDVVAFSVVTDFYPWVSNLCRLIKAKINTTIVLGGIHPTSFPQLMLTEDKIDYIVVGEGENTFLNLVKYLSGERIGLGDINGLGYRENGDFKLNPVDKLIEDINIFPFPDKELYYRHLPYFKNEYFTIASRNCPFRCSFCTNDIKFGLYGRKKIYRRRSVDNLIEELTKAKEKYNYKSVRFSDEIFPCEIKWMKEFSMKYNKYIDVPYSCFGHPSFINPEIVESLKKSKCNEIIIGIQSLDPAARKKVLFRNESNDTIKNSIELIKNAGIGCSIQFIVDLPKQDESDLMSIAAFYKKYKNMGIEVNNLRYYPGTKIVDIAYQEGLLAKKDLEIINNGRSFSGSVTFSYSQNNRAIRRMRTLLIMAKILPAGIYNLFIKIKLYRWLPSLDFIGYILLKRTKTNPHYIRLLNNYKYTLLGRIVRK